MSRTERTTFGALRPALRLVVIAVPLAATVLLIADSVRRLPHFDAGDGLLALAVGLGILAADLKPFQAAPSRKTSLASVPTMVGILLLPPPLAAAVTGVSSVAANILLRRPWFNALYNAGLAVLGVLLGSAVAAPPITPELDAVVRGALATLVYSITTVLLASLPAAIQRPGRERPALAPTLRETWTQALALDTTALSMALLIRIAPWAAILPMGFLPLVYGMNRALEGELRAREQLATVLSAQRRFLTDVSHNVGNPLSTILLSLSLVRTQGLRPAEIIALRDSRIEVERLATLFRRLRVLAETDEEIPLRMAEVRLATLADEVVQAYSVAARRKRVRLARTVDSDVNVLADPDLLRQALANLVENAVRHSVTGGSVEVVVSLERRAAQVEVRDQGPGIPADRVAHIFERFERGPDGGSGLGLSIVRSVVERHGGQVEVESVPGDTRFRVLLSPSGRSQ